MTIAHLVLPNIRSSAEGEKTSVETRNKTNRTKQEERMIWSPSEKSFENESTPSNASVLRGRVIRDLRIKLGVGCAGLLGGTDKSMSIEVRTTAAG